MVNVTDGVCPKTGNALPKYNKLTLSSHRNPTIHDELLKRSFDIARNDFPWIENFKDRSVTELEMRMILERAYKGDDKFAWFFSRDPYYLENIPKDKQHIYASEGEIEHQVIEIYFENFLNVFIEIDKIKRRMGK